MSGPAATPLMHILYLTQWFHPEPGIVKGADFVRALEAAGHRVTVVTGFPNYPEGKLYPGYRMRPVMHEVVEGVPVTRLALYPSHDSSSLGRALNFLSFFASALIYGLLRARRFDLVYVYHPPITVGLAAALFGWVHGRRFILEIQDLWPDTIAASGMAGTARLARVLGALCRLVYARSKHIIVQSEGMRARLIERGVADTKISVIRNWADATAQPIRPRPREPDAPFRILYAGNLGRMQALDTAIRAVARARAEGCDVELVLMGGGIDAEPLRALAADLAPDAIRFVDRVPVAQVPAHMAEADALLLHLARDPLFEITIPSKTQFYLASGMPVIAGVGGEAGSILRESGAALVVDPGDEAALAAAMREMAELSADRRAEMGRRGRSYYDATLSFDAGMTSTLAVIAQAGAETPRG